MFFSLEQVVCDKLDFLNMFVCDFRSLIDT